tara:strand:- start:83 stop:490 length:408 start_codon:yes stop_codon:yes gene_type:complete
MNKLINLTAVGIIICIGAPANATQPHNAVVQDHYKTVIIKKPQTVEICSEGNGKTDLENFITGGLIGGAIGNNIPGEKGGGAIGAIIGGALNAERNKGMTCRTETHYKKEMETIYSHSTIKFNYNGRSYSVSFKK